MRSNEPLSVLTAWYSDSSAKLTVLIPESLVAVIDGKVFKTAKEFGLNLGVEDTIILETEEEVLEWIHQVNGCGSSE